MNKRLMNEVAFVTSREVLGIFAGCVREEEWRDAFAEIFERVKAGLEAFELQNNRMMSRLHPGRN